MDLNSRQKEIIGLVSQKGFVAIEALAQHFDVTAQTIRRDVNELCDRALLERYHGGAGLPSSVENIAYGTRQVIGRGEKRRIGRLAASRIPDHASLLINIGTTTEEVTKALLGHAGLRVVTNNINVANILRGSTGSEVIVTGGLLRNRDGGIVGDAAVETIRKFKVDIAVMGISGIDEDGTLLDFDLREVRAAQAIMESARKIYLVADHSKFGRGAMVRLGHLKQVDALFTDRMPGQEMIELLAEAGVELCVAPPG